MELSLNLIVLSLYEKEGSEVMKSRSHSDLSLVYEILSFVFRNEPDLSLANVKEWKIETKIDEKVAVCLSALLMISLSLGGQENALLSDSKTRLKMSIAYFLAILASRYRGIADDGSKETVLKNILRWLLINSEQGGKRDQWVGGEMQKI